MTAPDADGGEALLQACTDLGADYIFSSAGSEWAPVWEGLARREAAGEAAPRYLDLAHETIAVGMATGYAAVTGRVQAVLLHAGAGLLQGANAVQGALLTGVPVVVCSGESTGYGDAARRDPGSQWYRNLSIVGGPQAFAAPFTKWASAAADAGVLYDMVKRAGELAAQPPAGPVYVNTPVEVLLSPWQRPPAAHPTSPAPPAPRTVAADEDVEAAARLLAGAQRPVLAVESAGHDADAYTALVELPAHPSAAPGRRPGRAGRRRRPRGAARLPGAVVPARRQAGSGQGAGHRRGAAPAVHGLPGAVRGPLRRRRYRRHAARDHRAAARPRSQHRRRRGGGPP